MLIPFTRQLYTLVKSGLPLLKALQITMQQLPPGRFNDSISDIIMKVQQGRSLSESVGDHPRFFSSFYVSMLRSAEVSGDLKGILGQLSRHLVQQQRVGRQVQAAFMYPALLLIVSVAIMMVLLLVVMPIFIRIFSDLGGKLPLPTQILMALNGFILRYGLCSALIAFIVLITAALFSRTKTGAVVFNRIIWRVPLFGSVFKKVELGRFCRMSGALLSSGITLLKALEVAIETSVSPLLKLALEDVVFKVEQGQTFSRSLQESGVFPPVLWSMVQVGEESGRLGEILLELAGDYEEETAFAVSGLLSLLEPVLIIVMGGIVGFIVISLFFPILTVSGLVR